MTLYKLRTLWVHNIKKILLLLTRLQNVIRNQNIPLKHRQVFYPFVVVVFLKYVCFRTTTLSNFLNPVSSRLCLRLIIPQPSFFRLPQFFPFLLCAPFERIRIRRLRKEKSKVKICSTLKNVVKWRTDASAIFKKYGDHIFFGFLK